MNRLDDPVYSVSAITSALQELLEGAIPPLWVEGEVSDFRISQTGHWYFTLKDEFSQLPCVMFRNVTFGHRGLELQDGKLIRAFGTITIYPRGGVYQMKVLRLLPVGRGDLSLAFERLRERLQAEGLFDAERKRPLPPFPRRIGVITSPTGAAIRDILHVLRRRYPLAEVVLYPTLVQGEEAPASIVRALSIANRLAEVDVLILGRGGGSAEDLWAFNDEQVVRAVAASRIPVVSAVGHEIDYTLADFAADVRAPTPSAAAALVVPDRAELLQRLRRLERSLQEALLRRLSRARDRLSQAERALSPRRRLDAIQQRMQYLDELEGRLDRAIQSRLRTTRSALERLSGTLNALSPLATLARGYSICTDAKGRVVRSADAVAIGEPIAVRLRRGVLHACVTGRSEGAQDP
ncbi:MAG: exodeoxyribonuclease 7 large subunit [Candidatus Poribacteria bacterium]|nr:MAG: exodeoxyribonuclease 7 large subunit [Candidatus Poribacteria bacterium]